MTSEEINKIKSQFCKVIEFSQGLQDINADQLFKDWLKAKQDYIEAFNGELMYRTKNKVSFSINPSERNRRYENFIDEWCEATSSYHEFLDFTSLQSADDFFNNKISHSYKKHDGKVIPIGMKYIKALKFFFSNEETLRKVQDAASMIIQNEKVEGYFTISVHPLDFLSASENNCSWRSCHALDGEYKAGNLSYMTDPSTVICYLSSGEEEKLAAFGPNILWNSKKWRMFLYFSNDWHMIFAGRQYPMQLDGALEMLTTSILSDANLAHNNNWTEWTNKRIENYMIGDDIFCKFQDPLYVLGGKKENVIPLKTLIQEDELHLGYNDLIYSTVYKPYYSIQYNRPTFGDRVPSTTSNTKFVIGGKVICPRCNRKQLTISNLLQCTDCELKYGECEDDAVFGYCACCESRIILEEAKSIDGVYVCQNCYEIETADCGMCGNRAFKDELIYSEEQCCYICQWCKYDLAEQIDFKS